MEFKTCKYPKNTRQKQIIWLLIDIFKKSCQIGDTSKVRQFLQTGKLMLKPGTIRETMF